MQPLPKPKNKLTPKQIVLILAVLSLGLVLAFLILRNDQHLISRSDQHQAAGEAMHAEHAAINADGLQEHRHEAVGPAGQAVQATEITKGPHGGKLFSKDGYAVEVTIYEQNTPPRFRLYTYFNEQALDPAASSIRIELQRLGQAPQLLSFVKEQDYLAGNAVVEEPHSFKVMLYANYAGKTYQFAYEQVEARVDMTEQQLALNAIEILTAGPARIKSTLRLIGEIKLNADQSVQVVPRLNGIVQSVFAHAGDQVKRGQLLAVISSQSIADQRSELMAAEKRASLARITYQREKTLWEEKISAEQDYLQARQVMQEADIRLQQARQKLQSIGASLNTSLDTSLGKANDLTRFEIRSPIAGVITAKQIAVGQVMTGIENVFVVADLSSVWAEMTVYAKDINTVKVGQKVTVKATAFEASASGTVAYVGALVGEQSRTAMARVILPNPDRTWLPGLPVNVELTAQEIDVPLAVSGEGIQSVNGSSVVFGRFGNQFESRPIQTGRSDDKYVEVLKGLQAGDKYAAGNSFLVKAELGKAGASHDH